MPNGIRVRYAGMVICRQHPGTAAGVTFMTMEDESGFVNVVLYPRVSDRFAVLIKTTSFLGIFGSASGGDAFDRAIDLGAAVEVAGGQGGESGFPVMPLVSGAPSSALASVSSACLRASQAGLEALGKYSVAAR